MRHSKYAAYAKNTKPYAMFKRGALLVAFAGFVSLIWYTTAKKDDIESEFLEPPLVKAPQMAYKERAEDEGGMKVPNRDKQVFDLLNAVSDKVDVNSPEAQEQIKQAEEKQKELAAQQAKLDAEAKALKEKQAQEKAKAVAAMEKAKADAKKAAELAKSAVVTETKNASEEVAKIVNKAEEKVKESAKTLTVEYGIQMGSYRNAADAERANDYYRKKFPDVLKNVSSTVKRVDLGAKGVYYRAYMSGYPDKASAKADCDKLKALGHNCFYAKL